MTDAVSDAVSAALESEMNAVRRLFSRHLVGEGVELGAGHSPFPVAFVGTDVSYVDRWEPGENRAAFPELGDDAEFRRPDVVCDLDVDRLKPLDDESQDFVIASHVLEHLANPISVLADMHRVLRPGGVAVILLPDRRRTFDQNRPATTLDHLVKEYEAHITEVDDKHIVEFLRLNGVDDFDAFQRMPAAEKAEHIELHRRRSIHAHCWQEDEFVEVILYGIDHLGHEWELVDAVLAADEGPHGFEFGYVLRRSDASDGDGFTPEQRRQRFADTWALWSDHRRRAHAAVAALEAEVDAARVPEAWTTTAGKLARRAVRKAARLGRSPAANTPRAP